ncbi:MAG: PucR family transcriptional regulator, partial [Sedimentibacter sp.]
ATPGYDNSVHPDWVKIERSILNRTADFDAIKTVSLDANFQLAFTQKYPIIIKSPFYGGNVLRTNVWVDKQRLCEIIILEDTKPFNQGEIHLLQVFSQFIENYVRKNRSEFLTISDISILFIQMLESNVADTLKFKHIRNALNWEIEEFLVVLCVESHATCETPLLGVLRDTLSHQLKSSCVFSYHDHIVSIINVQKNGGYTALVQKIEQLVPSGSYTWGISYEFSRLEKTVKFYQQSLYVLNIAKEISKPRATMYEVAYYCMQKEVKKLPDLQTFVHPALRTLKENDKIKDTNYFITLYEFLLCGNNYTNAANHLNLHRNSLIYRISRIQEIINIDLYNKDNVKLLLLSYLILEEVIN